MLENLPTQSTVTELLVQPLFEVWQELCSAINENTIWKSSSTQAVRTGLTSINIAEAVKHFAASMQKVIALDS